MTPKLKEKLEAARKALAEALTASHAGDKALARLQSKRASVATEVEHLEAATERDPEHETAIARLATLREQQELLDNKLFRLQRALVLDEQPRLALEAAQRTAEELFMQATRPELDRLIEQATAALAPFYQQGATLELAVARCDAVRSLKAFLVNAGVCGAAGKPQRLLSLLDLLIDGEGCGWAWKGLPETTATAQCATV